AEGQPRADDRAVARARRLRAPRGNADTAELRRRVHARARERLPRARGAIRRAARAVPARRRRAELRADAERRHPPERRGTGDHPREREGRSRRAALTGMTDKPWLRAYPPGVPATIDPDLYPSLTALIETSFARFAAQPAFTNRDVTLSFADVERLSRAFAAYLQSLPGLEPGERVAV